MGGEAGRRGDIRRANISASAHRHLRALPPSPRNPSRVAGRPPLLPGSVAQRQSLLARPRLLQRPLRARGAAVTAPAPLWPRCRPALGREAATSPRLPPFPPLPPPQRPAGRGRSSGIAARPLGPVTATVRAGGSGQRRARAGPCLGCASVSLGHKANIITPSSLSGTLPGKIHSFTEDVREG